MATWDLIEDKAGGNTAPPPGVWDIIPDEPKVPGMEKLGPLPGPAAPQVNLQPESFAHPILQMGRSAGSAAMKAAQTPLSQAANDALGIDHHVPTMQERYDQGAEGVSSLADKYVQPVVDKIAGGGTYVRDVKPAAAALNKIPRAMMTIADFEQTPTGVATAAAVPAMAASPALGAGVGAGYATSMAPGAWEAAKEAYRNPSAENKMEALVQGAMMMAPLAHPAASLGKRAVEGKPIIDTTNPETIRRPATPEAVRAMAAIETNPEKLAVLQDQAQSESIPVPERPPATSPAERSATALEHAPDYAGMFDQADARDAAARAPIEARQNAERRADALRQIASVETDPAKLAQLQREADSLGIELPSPVQPQSPAEQSASVLGSTTDYAGLFDQAAARDAEAVKRARANAQARPEVPEEGIPENVARAQDARDRIALQLTGKPFTELNNPDRIAVDDLVSQGYSGAGGAPLNGHPALRYSNPTRRAQQASETWDILPGGEESVTQRLGHPALSLKSRSALAPAEGAIANDTPTAPKAVNSFAAPPTSVEQPSVRTPGPSIFAGHPAGRLRSRSAKLHPEALPDEQPTSGTIEQAAVDRNPSGRRDAGIEPSADTRGIAEGASIREPLRTSSTATPGRPTEIVVPGGTRNYPARYQVRELDEVYPSHNPVTFETNPEYRIKNDRNYSDPANQERVIVNSREGFDPRLLVNDNPTHTNGPSIVDTEGNVLGGNNRAMLLSRVYQSNPKGAAAYRQALIDKAPQFGVDPATVAGMRRPVLVREVLGELRGADAQRAVTDFNKDEAARLTPAEQAASDGRMMNDNAVHFLQKVVEDAGPEATLSDALKGDRGARVVNSLVDAGVFTMQEKPLLVDSKTGEVTPAGRERISKMLLGRIFTGSEQLKATAPELRAKLERVVSPVIQAQARPEWDIRKPLQDAIDYLQELQARGGKGVRIGDEKKMVSDLVKMGEVGPDEAPSLFNDGGKLTAEAKERVTNVLQRIQERELLDNQQVIGEKREYSPEAIAIARTLRQSPTKVVQAFRQYAQEEALSSPDAGAFFSFVDPPTPQDAFAAAFGEPRVDNPERGSFSLRPTKRLTPAERVAEEYAAKREAARNKPGLIDKAKTTYRDAKAALVDRHAPIKDLLTKAIDRGEKIEPKNDLEYQLGNSLRSEDLAVAFTHDNGLHDIIRDVENPEYLGQLLTARQADAARAKGVETGRDAARDQILKNEFTGRIAIPATKNRPAQTYGQLADQVNAYSRMLLNYAVDAGTISADLAAHLKREYPEYVPLRRVFEAIEQDAKHGTGGGNASLSSQSLVQRLKGSERAIENPLDSILEQTAKTFVEGEKNKAGRVLAGYSQTIPEFQNVIKEVTDDTTGHHPHTFSFLDNGQKRRFATTPEIAAAANSKDVIHFKGAVSAAGTLARVFKFGTTGANPAFALFNLAKDQGTAFVTSGQAGRTVLNPKVFLKSAFSALGHSELFDSAANKLYREMAREGAGGTSWDIARNAPGQTIEHIRSNRSIGTKAVFLLRHPVEILREAEDLIGRTEEFTRMEQYEGTRRYHEGKGEPAADARILGAKAARANTTDFRNTGNWGTPLRAMMPYLPAAIQGSRTHIRAFKERPVMTTAKAAGLMAGGATVATLWNLGSDDRAKAYKDIPEFEKTNALVLVPEKPTQDARGRWNVMKVPLPQGLAELGVPVRRYIEQMHGMAPLKMMEVAQSLFAPFTPIDLDANKAMSTLLPQPIKPMVESYANKDFFTNQAIVKDSLSKLPVLPKGMEDMSTLERLKDSRTSQQSNPWTSGTMRKIGTAMGKSPASAEHFVKGTFGGLGTQVLHYADMGLAKAGVIPDSQIGGEGFVDTAAARFTKAQGGAVAHQNFEEIKKLDQEHAGERATQKAKLQAVYEELKGLDQNDASARYAELQHSGELDKDGAKELAKVFKEKSATNPRNNMEPWERYLLHRPAAERAQFAIQRLSKAKPEERRTLYDDWVKRGVINDSVRREMLKLQAGPQ